MAGLDTRGFMSGAMQGFGLHQQHVDNTRRREREDQQFEAWQEDRQTAAEDRGRQIEREDEKFDAWREDRGRQNRQLDWAEFEQDLRPMMVDLQQRGELSDDQWRRIGEADRQFPGRLPTDLSDMYRARQSQQAMPVLQQLLQDPASVQDEQVELLENMPIPLHNLFMPEFDQALGVAQDLMNPETPTDMRSPEVIEAANQIWGPRLGEGKRISGMMPGAEPGTVVFELEVTDPDGTVHNEPMTRGRATAAEGDDEVLQVPVESLIDELTDAMALKTAFDQVPEARERVLSHAQAMGYIAAPQVSDEQRQMQELAGMGLDPQEAMRHAYGLDGPADQFETIELPNGRYGVRNTNTGEIVRELSAAEAAGGAGGISDNNMRQWYGDVQRATADMLGVEVDESGFPVPGQDSAGVVNAYSSLAANYLRQSPEAYGHIVSPAEAIWAVREAAGGRILSMEDARQMAASEVDNPDQNPGLVQQRADAILNDQYRRVEAELSKALGRDPGSLESGSGEDPDALIAQFSGGGQQGGPQPTSAQQPQGGRLMDQPWIQDLMRSGGDFDRMEGPAPGLGTSVGDGQGRPTAGIGLQDAPPPQPVGGDSSAQSPIGRAAERGLNQVHSDLDRVNEGLIGVTDWFKDAWDGVTGGMEYNRWARQVQQDLGGHQVLQAFRHQSDDEMQAKSEAFSFIESPQARQLIGDDPAMREAFMQDPQGFMQLAQQGLGPNEILQQLSEAGRVNRNRSESFPRVQ